MIAGALDTACPWGGAPCPLVAPDGTRLSGVPCEVVSLEDVRRAQRRISSTVDVECVGVSFQTAPIALRERLCVDGEALQATLSRVRAGCEGLPPGIRELAILSTCNRVEFYAAVGPDCERGALRSLFADVTAMPAEAAEHVYELAGSDAVSHLFRVAAGLDSLVIGEAQIVGQVGEAYARAAANGASGPVTDSLFQGALRAGRRARSETGINRKPATVSSVAVWLASDAVRDLSRAAVLVVGAGEMGELAVNALRHRGARDIRVVSRTHEHAARLADRVGGRTFSFMQLREAIAEADIVITSTAAPHSIITRAMVEEAMSARPDRALTFIDIALPRDVEASVAALPNVHVHDLDGLKRHVDASVAERATEIPRVEAIVADEVEICLAALRRLDIAPLIGALRTKAEAIRTVTLERTAQHFAHLSEADRERIAAFSESLVNRLLHEPMVQLRASAAGGRASELAAAVRDLFALESMAAADRSR